MAILLDTCVVIDLLRKHQLAATTLAAFAQRPHVCAVTAMELYAGMRSQREEVAAEQRLSSFVTVSIDGAVFRRAGTWLKHFQASHGSIFPMR